MMMWMMMTANYRDSAGFKPSDAVAFFVDPRGGERAEDRTRGFRGTVGIGGRPSRTVWGAGGVPGQKCTKYVENVQNWRHR